MQAAALLESVGEMSASKKILYLEEDDDIREMMESFLEVEGYAVASFPSAEEGLDALAREGCDLLLTDSTLSGEDAAWLVREARARNLLDGIPIVVVSTDDEAKRISGATFLRKPVRAEVLRATLDPLLARRVTPMPSVEPVVELALYVARSRDCEAAQRNLGRILHAVGREHIRVVVHDLDAKDPATHAALDEDRIVVLPTLVKKSPLPKMWIAGDLSRHEDVTRLLTEAVASARRVPSPAR
jgi:DNA-binding response OmpR family regulator